MGVGSGRSSDHCGSVHSLRHLYLCDVRSVIRVRTDAGCHQLMQLCGGEREREKGGRERGRKKGRETERRRKREKESM